MVSWTLLIVKWLVDKCLAPQYHLLTMDLDETLLLNDAEGKEIQLPLKNLLRITMVKLMPFFLQYQEETKDSTISGFNTWIGEKLNMGSGVTVLL